TGRRGAASQRADRRDVLAIRLGGRSSCQCRGDARCQIVQNRPAHGSVERCRPSPRPRCPPTPHPTGAGGHGHDRACERRANNTYDKLLECVDAEGVFEHLEAFQQIADDNGGTRASGTPGYDASADYVASKLEQAGYQVTRQRFEFPYFEELADPVLEVVSPTPALLETGTFEFSGSGDVTGPVVPVDVNLDGDRASDSGCEPEDFAGLDLSGDA